MVRCFLALCVYKLFYIGLIWAAAWLLPFYSESMHFGVKSWPMGGEPNWQSRFATYDAAHYLYLAVHGYKKDDPSCAFYSLYPGLIYCGSLLIGSPFWAAFLIAQLSSLLGIWFVWLALAEIQGGKEANRCVILWLASPGALFLNVLYSETVFIGLLGGVFLLVAKRRWGAAAVLSLFLPLARPVGLFMILPLKVFAFQTQGFRWRSLLCFLPAAGFAAHLCILWFFTGNPWEGVEAQRFYSNHPSIDHLWKPGEAVEAFLQVRDFHDPQNSAIDRALFLLVLLLLPAVFRRGSFEFAWVIGLGIIPAITNFFLSYTRFVTMAVPVFIVLSRELGNGEIRYWLTVAAFGVFQLILLFRHINFYWAG